MPDSTRPAIIHHANGILDFIDSSGVLWTVSEIARLDFSERLISMLPHAERRAGWLLFESEHGDRRRFTPVPKDWRDLATPALEACLRSAVAASSTEHRRRTDEVR